MILPLLDWLIEKSKEFMGFLLAYICLAIMIGFGSFLFWVFLTGLAVNVDMWSGVRDANFCLIGETDD